MTRLLSATGCNMLLHHPAHHLTPCCCHNCHTSHFALRSTGCKGYRPQCRKAGTRGPRRWQRQGTCRLLELMATCFLMMSGQVYLCCIALLQCTLLLLSHRNTSDCMRGLLLRFTSFIGVFYLAAQYNDGV